MYIIRYAPYAVCIYKKVKKYEHGSIIQHNTIRDRNAQSDILLVEWVNLLARLTYGSGPLRIRINYRLVLIK